MSAWPPTGRSCPSPTPARGVLLLDGSFGRWADSDESQLPLAVLRRARCTAGRPPTRRISKLGTDPDNGLASVEALFVAYHLLGRATDGLLDHYRWAEEFLRINSLPSLRYSGERGSGVRGHLDFRPHPRPLSPEYRGRRGKEPRLRLPIVPPTILAGLLTGIPESPPCAAHSASSSSSLSLP